MWRIACPFALLGVLLTGFAVSANAGGASPYLGQRMPYDAFDAMPKTALKVDGGMVRNDWFCQRLADLTGLPVDRPVVTETTALGAAYLAGH